MGTSQFLRIFTVVITANFAVFSARADNLNGNTATNSSGAKTPAQQDPNMPDLSKRYQQANDNLRFQAIYLQKKMDGIEDAVQHKREAEALTALGGFCLSSETSGTGLNDCVRRYKDFQGLALARIRAAIGTNDHHIGRLVSGRNPDGTITGGAPLVQTDYKRDPYTPDVPTLVELEAEYKKSGGMNGIGPKSNYNTLRQDAKKWVQELAIHDPKAREIKFRAPVAYDPSAAEEKERTVVMKDVDAQGIEKNDDEVLQYEKKKAKNLDDGFKPVDQSTSARSQQKLDSKTFKATNKIEYDAFTETRKGFIGVVEKKMGSQQAQVGKIRSPANGSNSGGQEELYKTAYKDTDKIRRPPSAKESHYIQYDLTEFWKTIKEHYPER